MRLAIFRHFRKIAKSDYRHRHICPSVRLYGTSGIPLDEFSWNLIFECFSQICWENLGFIRLGQVWRLVYMKTYTDLLQCLFQFFLEWNTRNISFGENQNTRFMFNSIVIYLCIYFWKFMSFMRMWKNMVQPNWPQMNIQYGACALHAGEILLQTQHIRNM